MPAPVKISEAVSLAMHACFWLATDHGDFHPTRKICDDLCCSQAHLAKVIQALARARLVESLRGPAGGVRLASAPEKITLLAIYEAIEGATAPQPGCLLPAELCNGSFCVLGRTIAALNRQFVDLLSNTTLSGIRQVFKD